jgi:hypothetical protein
MPRQPKKSKLLDLAFNLLGLPLRIISGPALRHLPPKAKLIVVALMLVIVILIIFIGGIAFSQLGTRPINLATTTGASQVLPDGSKVLEVPYLNQYKEPDGSLYPASGWQMCGAASVVMIAGFYGKIPYGNDTTILKKFVYEDMGQNLPRYCQNYGGAFSITAKGVCNSNTYAGMVEYLQIYNLKAISKTISFDSIKTSIDAGHPLIMNTSYPYGHIFVIKGYTPTGQFIVNDSFKNWQDGTMLGDGKPLIYSENGKGAVYNLTYTVYDQPTAYLSLIEVSN